MSAIDFVIRTGAGSIQRGSVGGSDQNFVIPAGTGNDISLNIAQANLRGYDRAGSDLLVTLADGRVIVLQGYFDQSPEGIANELFLSTDGLVFEVDLLGAENGAIFAQYSLSDEVSTSGSYTSGGKFGAPDGLAFNDDPQVLMGEPGDEVSMLASSLLGLGGMGAGVAGLGLAGALLPGLVGDGGNGSSGNGGMGWQPPTVNDPDSEDRIGGRDDPTWSVSGTATEGSVVTVDVGGQTGTAVAEGDGTWEVVLEGENFPVDGTYEDVAVTVTDPDDTVTDLTGPTVVIDTMPPVVDITEGTVSAGDLFNAEGHAAGVVIAGTSEPGVVVTLTSGTFSQAVIAAEDGSWSFDVDAEALPGGEYLSDIEVTATDDFGNATVVTDQVEIDTVPHPLVIDSVTADNIVTAAESDAGFQITGSSTAGAVVTVVVGDLITQDVTTGADGIWSLTLDSSVIVSGEYSLTIDASTVDEAGNPSSTTSDFRVDTVAEVALTNTPLTGDDLISATELDGGVVLEGTTQVGSSVTVTIEGVTQEATVSADGTWTATFESGALTSGDYSTTAQVVATDELGNTATITHEFAIDTETTVTISDDTGTINAVMQAAGVAISGTGEAGATVTVTTGGESFDAVVAADGTWTMMLASDLVPTGETTLDLTATAVDLVGNVATASHTLIIDTVTGITLDTGDAGGDNVVNAAERGDGVTITGTAEAGASVAVTMGGITVDTTVAADGTWSANFDADALPEGETQSAVSAIATDLAGNTASASGTLDLDTLTGVTLDTGDGGGDYVINAAERGEGLTVTGTAEVGASVAVTMGAVTVAATVAADGTWSAQFDAAALPEGETQETVTAVATDAVGNTGTATGTVDLDTVTSITLETGDAGGDNVVNAAERSEGITLTGTAEAGASVAVTMGGITVDAVAAADGAWSADFTAAALPEGETQASVTAIATDLAGNTATTSGTLDVDTLVRDFAVTGTPGGADSVVNAAEASAGLTLTGTVEQGASVVLTLDGTRVDAVVDASGNWTASFTADQLPSGERSVTLTADATDAAGNTDTLTQMVAFDTDAGILTIDPDPVETDDVVNAAEASDGVVLTGTSNPGQMVDVTMNGVTVTVQTDSAGRWQAPFAASQIAAGTYLADISATITDSAGNTLLRTDSVNVDTEVLNFAVSDAPVTADDVVNAAERIAGITLAGTTEAGGSTVELVIDGVSYAATVAMDGTWSAPIPAVAIPEGTSVLPVTVRTVDPAGNPAETTTDLTIDTEVEILTVGATGGADGVINAAEAATGLTLTGEVEIGSSVVVTFGGMAHVATVAADGNWAVEIPPEAIPPGEHSPEALIEATDAAGNTRQITQAIAIDTEAPDTPAWVGYGRNTEGVDEIRTEITEDTVYFGHVVGSDAVPSIMDVALDNSVDVPILNRTYHTFAEDVPDGSHLVLTSTDAAGNTSGAYLVTDDPAGSEVVMTDQLASALSRFQIETIDLQFAEDSHLTITEDQIAALSSHTNTLTIEGGSDDSVTLTGATATGTTAEGYNSFTMGDVTVLIDDDITQVNPLI